MYKKRLFHNFTLFLTHNLKINFQNHIFMQTQPFIITVNETQELSVAPEMLKSFDAIEVQDNFFHIIKNNKAYRAEIINTDYEHKSFTVSVNGNSYDIKIADKFDRLVKQIGLTVGNNQKQNIIKSPMPGLVLQLNVNIGQEISKGETLLILEAMKMENVIKATGDGIVKAIHVKQGAAVEKGQLLIEME
jgi:biotin carboxyl carrier protein